MGKHNRHQSPKDYPMRVAVLTEWWPSLEKNHEGIFVRDQVEALLEAGHDMQVIAVPPASGPRFWRWSKFMVKAAREFTRLHSQKPFDLIHAHEAFPAGHLANQLAYWNGIPSVITQHCWPLPCSNVWPEGPNPTNNRWPEAEWSKQALDKADQVMAVSTYLRDRLDRGVVIPLGIDRRFYELPPPRAVRSPWKRRFLFVGSFCQRKGIDAILDAISYMRLINLTGWEFVLMGDGPMWADVIARTRGITGVTVVPPGDREAVLKRMAWADVFVFPSRGEGFGVAGIEAAVAGRPVIVGKGTATDFILGSEGNPVEVTGAALVKAMFNYLTVPDRHAVYTPLRSWYVAGAISRVYEQAVRSKNYQRPELRQMEASS